MGLMSSAGATAQPVCEHNAMTTNTVTLTDGSYGID